MTIMLRAGWDGKTRPGSIADADGIPAELRLAADDLAMALLRLLRAVDRERASVPLSQATPSGAGQEERMAYTVPEAARLLGVSGSLLREQIRAGHIPTFRVGTRLLVSRVDLERLAAGADAESRRVMDLMADRRRRTR